MYSDLIGKPFQYGGRGPGTFDCYGLCMEVYKRLNIILPDYQSTMDWKINQKSMSFAKSDFTKLDKPEPFCLVSFTIYFPYVSHVGVVLEDLNHFLSISMRRTVSIESLDSPRWSNRIDGFWRYEKN